MTVESKGRGGCIGEGWPGGEGQGRQMRNDMSDVRGRRDQGKDKLMSCVLSLATLKLRPSPIGQPWALGRLMNRGGMNSQDALDSAAVTNIPQSRWFKQKS